MSRFLVLALLAACSLGRHAPLPAIDPKGATLEAISVLDGKPSLVLDSDKNFQFVPL